MLMSVQSHKAKPKMPQTLQRFNNSTATGKTQTKMPADILLSKTLSKRDGINSSS